MLSAYQKTVKWFQLQNDKTCLELPVPNVTLVVGVHYHLVEEVMAKNTLYDLYLVRNSDKINYCFS